MGKQVEIPEEYHNTLRKLTPDFVLARYPDVAYGVPYELYDEDIAKEKLKSAREVIE